MYTGVEMKRSEGSRVLLIKSNWIDFDPRRLVQAHGLNAQRTMKTTERQKRIETHTDRRRETSRHRHTDRARETESKLKIQAAKDDDIIRHREKGCKILANRGNEERGKQKNGGGLGVARKGEGQGQKREQKRNNDRKPEELSKYR